MICIKLTLASAIRRSSFVHISVKVGLWSGFSLQHSFIKSKLEMNKKEERIVHLVKIWVVNITEMLDYFFEVVLDSN